ncbi:hypothetical protein [Streptomyces inhibens]|uniref:hypothetical protein n=1 Tax=Streptomyces inhibens TaxID=2293571 RepID=UPI001EE6E9D1|nr:hypothetical protein [Streptomyces inhibens]UKY51802.1 hypothetical protein KI385_25315 [Streptomyces inhibens]
MSGEPARLTGERDGALAVLGPHRLEAAEEAVRAAPPGAGVSAVSDTTETAVRISSAASSPARKAAAPAMPPQRPTLTPPPTGHSLRCVALTIR